MSLKSGKQTWSKDSASNGVLIRLIENWLTSTPERGLEIPFAQLLLAEGHTIIHIDSHGPTEQGKDIITIDASGVPCGYQLKQGNINGRKWDHEVLPELENLVRLPAIIAKLHGKFVKPHLVTTGTLTSSVQLKLTAYNTGLAIHKFGPVELMDGHDLTRRFVDAFGQFVPLTLDRTRKLLEFYLEDGSSNLDRRKFWEFLVDFDLDSLRQPGQLRRIVSGLPIVTTYAVAAAIAKDNYFAELEAFVLSAGRIASLAESRNMPPDDWKASFDLAKSAAASAVHQLAKESLNSEHLLEGSHHGDGGEIWRTRFTILAGVVSASALLGRIRGDLSDEYAKSCTDFVRRSEPHLFIWGESAASYFWLIYWWLSSDPSEALGAQTVLARYAYSVARENSKRESRGLPFPHRSPDECLRDLLLMDSSRLFHVETFRGRAYSVNPMVYELARCWRRQLLGSIWHELSSITHATVDLPDPTSYLDYKREVATERSAYYPRPSSWHSLREAAEAAPVAALPILPDCLKQDIEFALLFALVHPHRLDIHLTSFLTDAIQRIPRFGSS